MNVNRTHHFDVGTVEQSKFLFTKRPHLANYGGKMIQVYGPLLWNSLPKEIHDSTSLPTFKNKIKSHYVAQYDL